MFCPQVAAKLILNECEMFEWQVKKMPDELPFLKLCDTINIIDIHTVYLWYHHPPFHLSVRVHVCPHKHTHTAGVQWTSINYILCAVLTSQPGT